MTKFYLLGAIALISLAGCKRDANGDLVVERPGDVTIHSSPDTIHLPDKRTLEFGTKTETLVVKKPTLTVKKVPPG